ncbi:MAG: hypothetical protein HY684_06240 [Chloroflexi bacterium]|nr:hypothetical protein [Chloroflexota bacterium]
MEFVVIGGGCYGCFHTRQLRKAHQSGKIHADRFLVVDRHADCRASREFAGDPLVRIVQADWPTFLCDYLDRQPPDTDAQMVPACWAPHLFFDWLTGSVQRALPGAITSRSPCDLRLGLPYEQTDAAGNRFLSEAGWRCPASCIEPAVCPAIKKPRDWNLAERIARAVPKSLGVDLAEVFLCRHYAYGVGTIPARELLAARDRVLAAAQASGSLRAAIATSSHCHGVVGILHVDRA